MLGFLWGKIWEAIDETVFPSNIYCICCGSLIDATRPYSICDQCMKRFHWINGRTCSKCGKALPDAYRGTLCYDCMMRSHFFIKGYSCLTYGLHERTLLLEYKYNGKRYLARKLGDILYDRISCENLRIDGIIPVPIHINREKKRGYNQAALMAKRLSTLWGVPLDDKSLMRKTDTPLLRSLSPVERETALQKAFVVPCGAKARLRGKRLLLVDDIYTTGITADACSKTLLEAGAEEVRLLTLASGGNRKPKSL